MRKPLFVALAFLLIFSTFIFSVNAVYPYEDFLTYNEVDLGDKITVTENQLYWAGMTGVSHGVSKNISYNYWGSYCNYSFQVRITGISLYNKLVIGAISNGNFKQDGVGIRINGIAGDKAYYQILEYYCGGDHASTDYFETPWNWNTWLYCRFWKKALNVYCEFYLNSNFTNLYQNLTHTLQADQSYDYALPLYGWGEADQGWSGGYFKYLIPRADLYKVDLSVYSEDELLSSSIKPILIDGSSYGTQTAWFYDGEYSLAFSADLYDFLNWTETANLDVGNNTAETTTLAINGYGALTLYMGEWFGTSGVLWWLDRTTTWIGLIGLFICMIAPIMAFHNFKKDEFETASLWLMCILIIGIPLIIGWLWG